MTYHVDDFADYDEYDDVCDESEEWQTGECDRCYGGPPITSPLGTLYCACQIGQGAAPEDCLCGPQDD